METAGTPSPTRLMQPSQVIVQEHRSSTEKTTSPTRASVSEVETVEEKISFSKVETSSRRSPSPSKRITEEKSEEISPSTLKSVVSEEIEEVKTTSRSPAPIKHSREQISVLSDTKSSSQQSSSYVSEIRSTTPSSPSTSRSASPSKIKEIVPARAARSRSISPSKTQVSVKEHEYSLSSSHSSPTRQVSIASAQEIEDPQWQNVRESSSFTDTEVVVKQMFTEFKKHFEGELVVGSKTTVDKIVSSDVLAAKHFMIRIPATGVTMKLEDALMLKKVTGKSNIVVRSLNELVLAEDEEDNYKTAMIEQENRLESSSQLKREYYDSHKHIFVKPGGSQQISFEQFISSSNLSDIRIKDMKSDEFVSLREAFERGIIDRQTGEFFDHSSGASMSFFDAADLSFVTWSPQGAQRSRVSSTGVTSGFQSLSEAIRGLSFDAQKAAMQERYRVSDESLTNLAAWLSEVETRIASLGALHEDVNRLAHQQAVAKTVKEELEINRKVVNQALDQVRQISKEGAELLSASEISNLQRSAESIKSRYDTSNVNADKLLRRIDMALEELQKFSNETRTFIDWLNASQRTLAEYEKYLSDVSNLRDNMDQFRQFSTDVISHQADLRFLTMAAQKFMDESKTYLRQLNEIRTAHPDRLGHIEALESEVKSQVNEVTNTYQILLNRVNKLSDQLGGLGERKRNYHETVEKATVWLNDAQKQAKKLLEEPAGAEPRQIQDQLDRVRSFNMDIIQQGRLIDNARHAGESLIDMLPAGSPEKSQIQETIKNLHDVYQQMVNLIGEKTNELQVALIHSQDIEDGLNRLLKWMDDVESQIKIQSRPASLIRERLDQQIHEHRVLTQEIEGQRSVLEAMTQTAQQAKLAKKVEQKLRDMHSRYDEVLDKLRKNGQVLDEVSHQLDQFNSQCSRFEDWLSQLIDSIEEGGVARSAEEVQARLEDVIRRKNQKKSDFEEVIRAGRELVGRRDVTDTSIIKDRLRQLEQLWKEMDVRLTEQERSNRLRMEQLSAYETLRAKVLEWLLAIENKIERLEPVSLDKDAIRRQAMEIKPLIKEHADYRPTIDKVNELGRIYDSLISEERASSRMSIKSSPTRSEYTGQQQQQQQLNSHCAQQNGHSNGHGPHPQSNNNSSHPGRPIAGGKNTLAPAAFADETLLTPTQQQQQQQHLQLHQQASTLNHNPNNSERVNKAATQPKHHANPAAHASFIKSESAMMPEVRSPLAETSGSTSGFSSRQSSVEQFASIELDVSPVQQQLSEINHRYQIIGVKLSDRQRDLDGLADEVKRHHDTMKSLSAFVQTKERQLPKDVSPASKELADKQYSVLKEIQNDLADRQNEMDRVKIEVTDLLRRKPNAIGADSLQHSLHELVSKWSTLQSQIRDQLALLNDFRDFQDTHKLLDNWLNQKDKMFQVLGPIAHEPRMITAQMQQVHVMRDEFTSQEPLMRRMNQSGNEICSKMGSANPAARKVKEGMDDIRKRWDELLGRLEERERNLDAATGATQEFHQAINKLQDFLQNISDNFDRLGDDGADIHDQLRRLAGLEDDLERQRPLLAEVESMCDHLCDILSDPASKSEIKSKFAAADRLYNNLNRKLSNRRAELENSLKEDREFVASLKEAQDWFDEIEHKLSADFRISADEHILRQQIERYEPVYREVLDKEHEVHILLSKGNEIIQKLGRNKPEAQQLKAKMDNMRKNWEKIKREATERHTRLQTAMENCKRFYSVLNKFGPWLQGTEAKFNELKPPSYHRADLDKQIREIQTFKNEMSRHAIDFDNVRSIGDVFLGCTDIDKEKVRDDLDNLQRRWNELSKTIMNRAQDLDDIAARLGEFNDKARDVGHTLQRMEDRAASHDDGVRDARTLEKMKSLLRETQEFHKDLNRLRAYGESLINGAPIGCDTRHISDTMDELERRHRELTHRLEDKCHELDAAAGVMTQFNNKLKSVQTNFGHLEDEFSEFGPVGRDLRILNIQMTEVRTFKDKLHRADEELKEAEREARDVIAQGYTQDAKGLRTQLDNLKKQLSRLNEKANKRESGIEAMLEKLTKFYDDLGDVQRSLNEASNEERNFRPVGADVETIRQQQEEFKHFRRNLVEPLGKAIEEINRIGQGLIQSAPAGVNTVQLESDIEKLNSEWNLLKERMNERERTLDAALLHSGKFQEALASVEKWLQETEEMASNQKPPSGDYKVVKAQLQEQKFLIRLIQDRHSNINSLMRMGEDVMKNVAPAERSNIQNTLEDIRERYDKLHSGAKRRMDALERTLPVAKSFQDKMAPLVDWLDHAEKKLTSMQTIPTDANRAAQRAQEHKNFHRDILDHKRDFEELTEIAQTLMSLVGDEEARTVVDSMRELTDRYTRLVEESERLEDMLRNAKEGIRAFSENYDELLSWISEMERRLQRYQILSVYPEKLQQQLEELTELGEDIADHQRQVDQVVSAGQDMMRFATGDDAFNLKDRLDNLQARYNDLASKAAERVRQAQEALPIAQNFHQNHEKVSNWIDEAETVLKSVEGAGLNAQESAIHRLEQDISQVRKIIEVVNHLGPQLCQLSPGEGANVIESMMTRLNRRFDAICEQIQRKAERIELSKQRNSEVIGDLDKINDWFRDLEKQLQHAEPIIPDPDALSAMLKEHKAICEDVSSQKGRVRDLLAAAKKLMRESTGEDQSFIRDKAENLKDISNRVSQMCADRLSALEQALPLAEHFFDTHAELVQWLEEMETEAELLGAPALNPAQIKKQQDKNKALLQSMSDHKPLLDKLNKTGAALIKLVPMEEGRKVQYIMNQDNQRYNDLRNLLKNQQQALEEAMQSTAQFADKLDGMLNALASTADQLNNAEPISAHVEKIQEQISDNNAIVDDLEKKSSALDAVRRAAKDVISKADGDEPAVRDIKKKLAKLNDLWEEIQGLASKRGRSLNDALSAAERFWDELNAVMRALKELQDNINAQEPPAVEPSAIQQQQEVLQEIREEIGNTKPEVDQCKQAGTDLMRLCGEPDKPEVKKHIEDLDQAWQNVMTLYAKREQSLADALSKAMGFHNTLQDLLEFLDSAEERYSKLGPIASDIATVKHQIADLKDFKDDVDPHMVQVEALNRQAKELTERTTPDQARPIREALKDINKRWAALNKGIVDRQKELENALLRLGQFQHALNELLTWINKTDRQLEDVKIVVGDPQVIEVELAKHKVLMNDIQAHQSTVDSLNKAGHQLIELDRSSRDAGETQSKLANLNARWQSLQDKANDKQRQLEAALREAQLFSQEIQDLLMWLSDVDQQLASSKPVGGLPETAREQLNRFMELYNEIDSNRHKVENTLSQGADFVRRSDGSATNLQHSLKTLKSRWDTVLQKANDRKIKLEIALREATEFHEALQQFVDWLTDSEKYLSNLKPVSRLLPSVLDQIEEHKNFQKDVSAHREVMLNLDKKGTHLKYFSQKQDVILIKNLLVSVQHRWERVVSKAAERTRALDHGYKEAKEFHDSYEALDKWLTEAEHTIEDLANVGNDPEKIKRTLSKHKEFQRALAGKQATYDATMRAGRLLKDKAPKQDVPTLQKMLDDLKDKWNRVCAKAVDKQRKLEEALLFSGQFKDAVQALIDWLDKSIPTLDPNERVHGDLDTVNNLIEQHKQFQADLKNRQANLESVRKTCRELLRTASAEDAAHIRQQMSDLESKWENVMTLSNQKQRRLDDALRQAEQLHKSVHMLLEWLSDAEMKLRFAGPLPDDEATCRQQIAEHQRFMKEMEQQGHNKEKTIALAHEILQKCHPDAVSVIRHWITIIQSRWDEVSQWAKQRLQKLEDHLRGLRDILDLLEELMRWLLGAEATLTALEAQPLPDDIPATEQLIDDHKIFMDDMSRRQPDVDRIAKAFTTKVAPQPTSKTPAGRSSRGPHIRAGTPGRAGTPTKGAAGETGGTITNPRARELMDKWQSVWLMALERQKRLQDHLKYLRELEGIRNFDFDEWRRRFLAWLNAKKMRAMDAFRKIDKDNDGKVTKQDFIDGIIESRFPTSRLEMERVADIFDRNGDGYVDHKEYIDTLRPDRDNRPLTEAEKIQDEVQRQVAKCTCVHRFKVFQVGEGKYRFGESQKLRLVRILRSTVMVRVGGGWVALEEFLVKNDPCRDVAGNREGALLLTKLIIERYQSVTKPFALQVPHSALGLTRCLPVRTTLHMADIEENPSSRAQSILSRPGSAPSVHSVHSTHSQDTANSSSATSSSVGCAVTHGQQQGGSIPAGSKGPQGRGFSHQLGSLPAPQPGGGTASTRSSKSPESRVAPPAAGAIAATSASKSRIPVPMSMVREKTEKSIPLSTQRKLAADLESERSTPLGSRPRTSQSRLTPSLGGSRPSSRPASRANSDLSTESLEGFRRRTPSASSATGTRIPTRRTPSMTRQKSDLQAREKGWR
ncbi:microtubule-actin cross-linking factor 1-like isoform X2 [Varroa jacobsoni]|uniref:microtubule-actin cross-linking factor 1-like isoform X2 n=1 Tax=Varroa jacobsoni TaxID=62625 RepID=UPI000BF7876D|nr:microtubule-actin cross-linking factor 1-like isoform X2 [Varroa jacobsoni]